MPDYGLTNTGIVTVPRNDADPAGVVGALQYNTGLAKLRFFDTAWRNLSTDAQIVNNLMVSGRVVYVDSANTNATDVRTDLALGSFGRPFKTIAAAALTGAYQSSWDSYVMVVKPGLYQGDVMSASRANIYMVLEAGVRIDGRIWTENALSIIGVAPDNSLASEMPSLSTISSPDPTATIKTGSNPSSNYPVTFLQNVYVENTGAGHVITTGRVLQLRNVQAYAAGVGSAVYYDGYSPIALEACRLESAGGTAVTSLYGQVFASRCSIVSNGPLATDHGIKTSTVGSLWIESCVLYSKNGNGYFGGLYGGQTVYRNNLSNTFLQAFYAYAGGGGVTGDHTEITGNIMNIRDAATVDAFYLTIATGPTNPVQIPVVMNNRYNKAGFTVAVNGMVNTVADNIGNLVFSSEYPMATPRGYPTGNLFGVTEATLPILTYLFSLAITLTVPQMLQVDNLVVTHAGIPAIEAYLATLGYIVDLSMFI